MKLAVRVLVLSIALLTLHACFGQNLIEIGLKWPTIGISVLVRNKAHILPHFLTCLYNLDYPKDRLYLWINSDFNEDNSVEILEKWVAEYGHEYNGVYIITNNTSGLLHDDEKRSTHWSPKHFKHVIHLREEALAFARTLWADYVFMLDADVILMNTSTLKALVSKDLPVVSPMLLSEGDYSNFGCDISEIYYYKKSDEYATIVNRHEVGCFDVLMVHTAVLISLRRNISDKFTYNPTNVTDYQVPLDDIITFATVAKLEDIPLYICNDYLYGIVPVPLEENEHYQNDKEQMLNLRLDLISRGHPLTVDKILEEFVSYPTPSKYGCSEIYMINLERRVERRRLMELSFKELGMSVKRFNAFDGSSISTPRDSMKLEGLSITLMPAYEDPYHKRPMKAGEVGCFLSHYLIWKEIATHGHAVTLVLEDDIRFAPYFRNDFSRLMEELSGLDWDFVYIGRKILKDAIERYAAPHVTRPLYSYWTLGYLITERGARKLLNAEPLSKMLPVDEFLPIMFNQHPNETWKSYFPNRNLKAFSAAPLLVYPTHYTGEQGYISDTEDSMVVLSIGERIRMEL